MFHSKRQGSVETSTYGAKFGSMRTAVDEAVSIRYMLRSLGVPVTKPTVMLGDNMSVIQSATRPESPLKKRHTALSYHYVQENAAANIIAPYHCPGGENRSDILTKQTPGTLHHYHVNAMME